MKEPSIGITFRETMKGAFALGTSDPKEGLRRGEAEGTTLAMHASITIDGLDRFIEDPGHAGGITGHIDFPPLGTGIPAKNGVFNIFSPTNNPKLKLMVYELAFEHGGKSYYLAGKKEVEDGPGFDLWKDTTTLFTRLHEGADKTGPVVGAGVLSLGMGDLMKLLSTVQAPGASSAVEKAATVAKFGRFFLGELWDSYVKEKVG